MSHEQSDNSLALNLRDMIFFLLKRWKVLLILLLIGALLGGGYALLLKNRTVSKKDELERILNSQTGSELIDQKKIDELLLAEKYYETAVESEEKAREFVFSGKVCLGSKTYFISFDEEYSHVTEAALTGILDRDENAEKLYASSGFGGSLDHFLKLVEISFKPYAVLGKTEEKNTAQNDDVRKAEALLIIKGWGRNEKETESLTEAIGTLAFETLRKLEEEYPDSISMKMINSWVREKHPSDLLGFLKETAQDKDNAYEVMMTAKDRLNSNELSYYELFVLGKEEEKAGFAKKWPVLGAIVLFFFGTAYLILYYLVSNRLRNESECAKYYGVSVLAIMAGKNDKRSNNTGLIGRWVEDSRMPVNTEDYLTVVISSLEEKNILISGDKADPEIREAIDLTVSAREGVLACGPLSTDVGSREMGKTAEAVILVAKLWKTRRVEFRREISIASRLDIPVLGVILIREDR